MNSKEEARLELEDALAEWELACDMDSGDESSYDWLSASASRLHQAERAYKEATDASASPAESL